MRVAGNVRHLRGARELSLRDLSARLAELGRPILPSGLMKIERADRRIDVDDLAALAKALETVPIRLLSENPDAPLTAEQYKAHEDQIGEMVSLGAEIIKAGAPAQGLLDYLGHALTARYDGMRPVAPSDIDEWNSALDRKATDDGR